MDNFEISSWDYNDKQVSVIEDLRWNAGEKEQ